MSIALKVWRFMFKRLKNLFWHKHQFGDWKSSYKISDSFTVIRRCGCGAEEEKEVSLADYLVHIRS